MNNQEGMKIPIDQAPAGPAMDAAVAEAQGWVIFNDGDSPESDYPRLWQGIDGYLTGYSLDEWPEGEQWGDAPELFSAHGVWRPSTDTAQAFKLIESQKDKPFFKLERMHNRWKANVYVNSRGKGEANTASLAICRAFLKAQGGEEITRSRIAPSAHDTHFLKNP